ncbi:hypothetical protein MCOR25_002055 [Pyricularia grisea]|uniref:N-acetyltransferase domain-containing protein n=1 Tax=Pyricularia grisea TaxID=148305 RepID=A0A6P8AMC0_PYRGI|nr:uncharacterized protein PgNI_12408 [Pyricularia grisea]KAI6379180.1 hypothetical protein MCOR25_002055 [Pyricularia grisea]TLD03190.1 hypothetical protein PgNI_12408 [Pyricularia grisea]
MATIKHASREDIPAILGMIRELADYEHELHSVETTEAKLLETVALAPSDPSAPLSLPNGLPNTEPTSPAKPARCLVLSDPDGTTCGMALYFYNYSTWRARPGIYLEDLYVRPAYRKKGYGLRLLATLAREVRSMQGTRLEWACLKWNEPSIKFYESIGARQQSEWVGFRVDGDNLAKLADMTKQ